MAKEPHEDLVAETIAEDGESVETVVDKATHKMPGFKRTEETKGLIAHEADRQMGQEK
jgi:hypothetical protein